MKKALRRSFLTAIFSLVALTSDSTYYSPFQQDTANDNYPYPKDEFNIVAQSPYSVHFGPETEKTLSEDLKNFIRIHAKRDLYVFSKDDITPVNTKIPVTPFTPFIPFTHIHNIPGFFDSFNPDIAIRKQKQLLDMFPTLEKYRPVTFSEAFDNAIEENPISTPLWDENNNPISNLLVIQSDDPAVDIISAVASFKLTNVPGTPELWREITLIHEVFHGNDVPLQNTYRRLEAEKETLGVIDAFELRFSSSSDSELNADQYLIHYINMKLAQGHEEYRGMREAWIGARAIGFFSRTFETHSHAGFLSLGLESDRYSSPTPEQELSARTVHSIVQYSVGSQFTTVADKGVALVSALEVTIAEISKQLTPDESLINIDLIKRQIRYLEATIVLKTALGVNEGNSYKDGVIQEVIDALTQDPAIKKKYDKYLFDNTVTAGWMKIMEDPRYAYNAICHQLAWGAQDKVGKEFLIRAREAYERYAPEYTKPKPPEKKPEIEVPNAFTLTM